MVRRRAAALSFNVHIGMSVLRAMRDHGAVEDIPLTIARLRDLLLDGEKTLVSLDDERAEETYVLEHRGAGWLVFFLERGRKRDFRKHSSEDAACQDLLNRLRR